MVSATPSLLVDARESAQAGAARQVAAITMRQARIMAGLLQQRRDFALVFGDAVDVDDDLAVSDRQEMRRARPVGETRQQRLEIARPVTGVADISQGRDP